MAMQSKCVETAVALLRKGEALAVSLNPEGYYLAFSGGKDSMAVYYLCKLAGVRFRPYYNITANDPPANIYFIRKHFPDVVFVHPKKNFFRLVETKGLPMMYRRYCCERLKEHSGVGRVVLTGVRAEESRKRASYAQFDVYSRRKEHIARRGTYTIEEIQQNEHQCIKGQDRIMLRPVLNWSVGEVLDFLTKMHAPFNPCYETEGRVGCMFCPFASKEQIERYEIKYPGFYRLLMRSLKIYWKRTDKHLLSSPAEYYDWWKSGLAYRDYVKKKSVNI